MKPLKETKQFLLYHQILGSNYKVKKQVKNLTECLNSFKSKISKMKTLIIIKVIRIMMKIKMTKLKINKFSMKNNKFRV